jgi:hypothetical protein
MFHAILQKQEHVPAPTARTARDRTGIRPRVGFGFRRVNQHHHDLFARTIVPQVSMYGSRKLYMRMLAPPTPAPSSASTVNGQAIFAKTRLTVSLYKIVYSGACRA